MSNSQIIDFYLGKRPDNRGRMIKNIWEWNEEQLEDVHDYHYVLRTIEI